MGVAGGGRVLTRRVQQHSCSALLSICSLAAPPLTAVAAPAAPPPPSTTASAATRLSPVPPTEATPIIANVVSLASVPAGQPNPYANTALQGDCRANRKWG